MEYYIFEQELNGKMYFHLTDEPISEDMADTLMGLSMFDRLERLDGATEDWQRHLFTGYVCVGEDKEFAIEELQACKKRGTIMGAVMGA